MAIREKLRKKFGSKKNGSGGSSPGIASNSPSQRTDIEYYKWNEIPKSKYRGKVDKEHQEMLDSYSMGDAFTAIRRASQALSGTFSPGGTKAQSRRGSWMSRARSGLGPDDEDGEGDARNLRRKSVASAGAPREGILDEDEDDTDNRSAANPRTPTAPQQTADDVDAPNLTREETVTAARPVPKSSANSPFTMEELEQAMSRTTMRPRRGTVIDTALPLGTVAT